MKSFGFRTMNEVSKAKTTHLQVEKDEEDEAAHEEQSLPLCDHLHTSVHDKENSPMMRAVLCGQVCKVYRFQTDDHRWLLVREQMSETPLSLTLPKQLLSVLIHEHAGRCVHFHGNVSSSSAQHQTVITFIFRVQEVKELGDLSPHWDGVRHDVISHCNLLIGCYQEMLDELDKLSASFCFKSSRRKSDKHLQFVPTNLHSQRMEVTSPDSPGMWYEVITFGAPADHHQSFKHGGLKRLLNKHRKQGDSCVYFSREESSRAKRLLAGLAQLQPQVFGLAEELLSISLELDAARLQDALNSLTQKTELFAHTLKDELVRNGLLAIHKQDMSSGSHAHSNGLLCDLSANQDAQSSPMLEGVCQWDAEYNEEEWGREPRPQEEWSPEAGQSPAAPSWQEQLVPPVVTLRDCVREAAAKAQASMSFVVLQEAMAATVAQGTEQIIKRRHAVFSQALSAAVCGFLLKLYGGLEDHLFLQQLHSVGILVQFESLLSTYGEEAGVLEDMEVGVADLSSVTFIVTEARTDRPEDLQPALRGAWGSLVVEVPLPSETFEALPWELKEGRLIRVHPVLFSIGINQHQSLAERLGDSSPQQRLNQQSGEQLRGYCHALTDQLPHLAGLQSLPDLLSSLDQSLGTKKRKNVEVLWSAAGVCRAVNGIRLTSCKSAKDRTSMSVTLEQCVLLLDRHALSREHFSRALNAMRSSRLSWGQVLGCYAQSGFRVCALDLGGPPSGPQQSVALKAPRRHLYPVAFLLVTSHLLVLWLIFSLIILLECDGCRMENVQKNMGCRKFSFSSVQLLTFPKLYRPPEGSFG
ncbi:type II inositol 3,4-bisphosphate 4-phosphatase-like isoform X3 [Antennarius striatus]|uniref:type II inositol 3,4-bisphosphate 4-phosphatase-like isoform X3 n=1 Tax=Antennarius striatus TaxID=241820 RepID=UPI0035B0A867